MDFKIVTYSNEKYVRAATNRLGFSDNTGC